VWCGQPSTARESAPAPDKIGRKGGKGGILWAHTYPTVSSRPRGRCVQSLVPIGSEMWICIRYKHSFLYVRYFMHIKLNLSPTYSPMLYIKTTDPLQYWYCNFSFTGTCRCYPCFRFYVFRLRMSPRFAWYTHNASSQYPTRNHNSTRILLPTWARN